jgi:cell wall-associated NlpC family hydrolase
MLKFTKWFLFTVISLACRGAADSNIIDKPTTLSDHTNTVPPSIADTSVKTVIKSNTRQALAELTGPGLVNFAQTLLGVPYRYASSNPLTGFDCSGFITYVFNHFQIAVPRSSVDFTNAGKEIALSNARAGDLILFTGTVDTIRIVGHMGIITENRDTLKFIHATSGRAYGVTVSALNNAYKRRFVKVIRVLSD